MASLSLNLISLFCAVFAINFSLFLRVHYRKIPSNSGKPRHDDHQTPRSFLRPQS